MKTKRIIYFLLIILGAVIMASDTLFKVKEYALILGIVLLMFGIYNTSKVWSSNTQEHKLKENSNHKK